jgi:hypothetical protein
MDRTIWPSPVIRDTVDGDNYIEYPSFDAAEEGSFVEIYSFTFCIDLHVDLAFGPGDAEDIESWWTVRLSEVGRGLLSYHSLFNPRLIIVFVDNL